MPNYLVRLRGSGEAVGIFAVRDLDDLVYWVDEVTDPADCEYAEIGSGSIIWEDRAARIPLDMDEAEADARPILDSIGSHDLGGHWTGALLSERLTFTPLLDDAPANDP